MAQFLAIMQIVLALLPTLIQAINALEEAFPQSGAGAAKLAVLQNTMQTAYTGTQQASVTFETLWPVLSSLTSSIVSVSKTLKQPTS